MNPRFIAFGLVLVTAIVSGCQNSGSGDGVKVYPRSELLVTKQNESGSSKVNTILVQSRTGVNVIQDFTYTADGDGTLTIVEEAGTRVNCEKQGTVNWSWINIDGNGSEVNTQSVQVQTAETAPSEIKVTGRSNYLLRVEIKDMVCFSYSLVFRVIKTDAPVSSKPVVGLSNAGQKDEKEKDKNQDPNNPNAQQLPADPNASSAAAI